MSWQPTDTMSLKTEFIHFAQQSGANISALCAGYGISRKTGYKWLQRYREAGAAGLAERPRRPLHSPALTDAATAGRITALRREHPAWGARKLRAVLAREGVSVPSAGTVHAVLRRGGLITAEASGKAHAWQRFERAAPNELWQMDFKGHFGIGTRGARCHPLTVLDDHSRYNLVLQACAGETCAAVQEHLSESFRRHGLPLEMLCDNRPPWGCPAGRQYWSTLAVWLLRCGVSVRHGRPHHPQTQGKEERFHRTLALEVLGENRPWRDLAHVQSAFDPWRETYNHRRPHEAHGQRPPCEFYQPSARRFSGELAAVESWYERDEETRRVLQRGAIAWGGRRWRIGEGFAGHPVALRETGHDGQWSVWFCRMELGLLDLSRPAPAVAGTWEELTLRPRTHPQPPGA
jgi:transposase InsO family protein